MLSLKSVHRSTLRLFAVAILTGGILLSPARGHSAGTVTTPTEAALNSALAGGGVVTFDCDGTIILTGIKTIATNTVLDAGERTITLSGNNLVQIFKVESGASLSLSNLTIIDGRTTTNGGAIINLGTLSADNCEFRNNAAIGNNGPAGANGVSTFPSNGDAGPGTAGGGVSGGAIYNLGELTLRNCTFRGNQALGGSGGDGGNGVTSWSNNAGRGGAGGAGGAAFGGAVYSANSAAITNCIFGDSQAVGGDGGDAGLHAQSNVNTFQSVGGYAGEGSGAGVYSSGYLKTVNSSFITNYARGGKSGNQGLGPVQSSSGIIGLAGAQALGGGICNLGTNLTINSTFFGNGTTGGTGGNGGAPPSGQFGGKGGQGGMAAGGNFYCTSVVGITNSTLSSGFATGGTGGQGGPPSGATGNPGASFGGNIYGGSFTVTVKNSIIAYAKTGGNNFGVIVDGGHNISSDSTVGFSVASSYNNLDPMLTDISKDQHEIPTCALILGSPAIDKGDNNAAPAFDQRGHGRVGTSDIGAYEYGAVVSISGSDANASESGKTGMFTITRSGGDFGLPLLVQFQITGTASNGTDYAFLSNAIVIPSGEAYASITVAPLFDTLLEGSETVMLTLVTNGYSLGVISNAIVSITDYDDSSRTPPVAGGVLASTARFGRFIRGTSALPGYHSFVVPIDFQQGVPLDSVGGNGTNLFPGIGWSSTTFYHLDITNYPTRMVVQNPIAAFGNRAGGSPLYYNQNYAFGIYAGNPRAVSVTNLTDALRIQVYDQATFTAVGTIPIPIPDISNTNEWVMFLTNGYTKQVSGYGLTTTLSFNNSSYPWPWGSVTVTGNSNVNVGMHLSHKADANTNKYIYMVELAGGTDLGWMVADGSEQRAWSKLYTLEFEARPEWRSLLLTQPQFFGQPLPPGYTGRSVEEFLTNNPPVTSTVSVPNSPASYTNLDLSPELRRHPVLDQFVADMGNDPILLANYVLNEIELSDAIDYNDSGVVSETSLNDGGVNRGALGTFLEGQGSPTEQCGLLVYLLRKAGVPAVYVFPPNNGLKVIDARLSKILRMQIHGAVDDSGVPYTSNQLITVNYPWVAAYLTNEARWVHIFPWLKDTQLEEGLDLYDYMPPKYDNAFKVARAYMLGDTNLLSLSPEDDSPLAVFPRFFDKCLKENAPGISLDDVGYRAWNRRNHYARWNDFPTPTFVTNSVIAVESLGSTGITNVSPALTNIFNTVSVEVSSVSNPSLKVSSGELRLAEVHNRRFVAWHTTLSATTHQLNLSLGTFRTNLTSSKAFSAASLNASTDTNILFNLTTNVTLYASNQQLQATIVHKRYRSLPSGFANNLPYWNSYLGLDSYLSITNVRSFYKGDVAAFCTDVGRVTRKMLDQHAIEIWKLEQSGATGTADVYLGSIAYLMGMSYYEKTARLENWVARLHKVQPLAHFQSGLALLHGKINSTNGAITLNQPALDMFFQQSVSVGNGTIRLDSGDDGYGPVDRLYEIAIVGGSALEHWVLNRFFVQSDSVSTARLLWLAQRDSSAVFLDRSNYLSEGEKFYPIGGTNKLKEASASIWISITNAFTTPYVSNQAQAYITPGKIRNDTGSYYGAGAMVFRPGSYGAFIDQGLNGGYSPLLPDNTLALNYTPYINLQVDNNNTFSLTPNPFVGSSYQFTSSGVGYFDLPEMVAAINTSTIFNPVQTSQLDLSWLLADGSSATRQFQMQTMEDDGSLFKRWLNKSELVADPVNMVTGEFYHDEVDLRLNGPMPLEVRRNYSSHDIFDYDFGYGWKSSYMPFLTVSRDTTNLFVYSAEIDGSVLAYRRQTNAPGVYTNIWKASLLDNSRFQNVSGPLQNLLNTVITRTTNGGLYTYTLQAPDGSTRVYKESTAYALSANIDRKRPYLDTWQDSRGNYFKFHYGTDSYLPDFGKVRRIESSNGNFLGFGYDVFGHIIEAYTGDGRRLEYEYDDYGDLIRVQRPDASEVHYQYQHGILVTNATRQAYSTHLVIRETKPDGRVLMNEYDSERRVINQYATVGPDLRLVRNGSFAYSNNFVFAGIFTNRVAGYTLITDCFTNVSRYEYTNGLITKIADPLGGTIQQAWYQTGDSSPGAYPNSLKTLVDKRGLKTDYQYDFVGNVTNITITGDLTGNGNTNETAVTTCTYNTNRLLTNMVDVVGNRVVSTYTNPISPFLRTTEERYASNGTLIALTLFDYYNVTNATVINNYKGSLGLLRRSIAAYDSPDAATNLLSHNPHGWLTNQIQYTGTSDPAVTNDFFYNMRGELVERTDAAGRKTQYSYNARGNLQWKESFDESGARLAGEYSYYNENGERTWFDGPRSGPEDYIWQDYDGAGRKTEEVHWQTRAKADGSGVEAEVGDSLYATSFFQYDPFGNLTKTVDPRGNYSRKFYDAVGQLTREEFFDADGTLLSTNGFNYNLAGDVTNSFNGLGGSAQKQLTSTGQPKFQRNADGSTNAWRYYLDGRAFREIQGNGAYWQTVYDDANRKTTRVFYSAAGAALATNIAELDRRGNLVKCTDAGGFVFTNSYDGLNRMKVSAGPPVVTVKEDCVTPLCGNYVTNILQQKTMCFYDAAGIVTSNLNALGEKVITTADALGRVVKTEIRDTNNALIRMTSTAYSTDHHSITVTNGAGSAALVSTIYTDNEGRSLLSVSYPFTNVREYTRNTYDMAGNLERAERFAATNTTSTLFSQEAYAYDGLNRPTIKADRDVAITLYAYDALSQLTNRTMPGGLQWQARYNNAGLMLEERNVGNGGVATLTNTYAYFSSGSPFAGLLQTRTDGVGVVCNYYYDDYLRVTNSLHVSPVDTDLNIETFWQFDARGLLSYVTESISYFDHPSVQRSYDAYGQLTSERVEDAYVSSLASQTWDAAGRRTGLTFDSYPNHQSYSFSWRADGLLSSVAMPGGAASYGYNSAGILTNRSVGSRSTTISALDGMGRPLAITNRVSLITKLAETLNWTSDGLLNNHTVDRVGDFTDSRSYAYADFSRRLIEERLNLDAAKRWTNSFAYDNGQSGGPGALTRVGPESGAARWNATVDAFSRLDVTTNTVVTRSAYGRANGQSTITASLDGQTIPVAIANSYFVSDWPLQWRATLPLATTGAHQLTVMAAHPSGQFTTNRSVWFTNNVAHESVQENFDAMGRLTHRVWKNPDGTTNRTENLVWDVKGRLWQVIGKDPQNNGSRWYATYDPFGRKIFTQSLLTTNDTQVGSIDFTPSYYDPAVEFLELGTSVLGQYETWKLYGPDLNGVYGGMNGVGGLEGTQTGLGAFQPTVSDARGNILGSVTNGLTVSWNPSRPTGYGAPSGYRPLSTTTGASVAQASAWRGKRPEPTGYIYMGARYYDPESGSFLSSDPMWNDRDPNFYSFAGGDPVNYFDANGRASFFQRMFPATAYAAGAKPWTGSIQGDIQYSRQMYAPFYIGAEIMNSPRVQATMKIAGGTVEAGVGGLGVATTSETGVGLYVSSAAFLHGLDTINAGLEQWDSNQHTPTYTQQGITYLTGSPQAGAIGDSLLGMGLTFGAGMYAEPGRLGLSSVNVTKVGDTFVKTVNPDASALAQWWGRMNLDAQAAGLQKLGTKAVEFSYENGVMITKDAGAWAEGYSGNFWSTWWEGTKALGTPFNDIRPNNIGANGLIFDPAKNWIQRGAEASMVGLGLTYAGVQTYNNLGVGAVTLSKH